MIYSSTTGELVTELTITNNSSIKSVVFSLPIEGLTNDLLTGLGHIEVTNPKTFNVGIGFYVSLEASPSSASGLKVQRATMQNITPSAHHKVFNVSFMHKLTADFTGYLNVVAYAAASAGTGIVTIENGYGQLSLKIE